MASTQASVLSWTGVVGQAARKPVPLADRSDEELMLAFKNGEESALTELFRRYKDRIYRFAFRLLGNSAQAEDVLQETFLRIHNNASTWQPSARFASWAFRIARNLCVDEKRKYWNRQVVIESQMGAEEGRDALAVFTSCDSGPRAESEDSVMAEKIREAIESLSPEQQEVMVLSKYHGMSYHEIAEILGISQESVKQRAYRAHMRLRSSLRPLLKEHAVR